MPVGHIVSGESHSAGYQAGGVGADGGQRQLIQPVHAGTVEDCVGGRVIEFDRELVATCRGGCLA